MLKKVEGDVVGFQSTLCSERNGMFKVLPSRSKFIQILNVSNSHWITVSNIGESFELISDAVQIYDSGRPMKTNFTTKSMICSFLKPRSKKLFFDIMNVDGQTNSFDCGVYAIAYATHLAFGIDPVPFRWDYKNLRKHLLRCLQNEKMEVFPHLVGRRKTRLRCIKSHSEDIHCYCRMPNLITKPMIICNDCKGWYHLSCVSGINHDQADNNDKWFCLNCEEDFERLKDII